MRHIQTNAYVKKNINFTLQKQKDDFSYLENMRNVR